MRGMVAAGARSWDWPPAVFLRSTARPFVLLDTLRTRQSQAPQPAGASFTRKSFQVYIGAIASTEFPFRAVTAAARFLQSGQGPTFGPCVPAMT
jgi:hypothetical protein